MLLTQPRPVIDDEHRPRLYRPRPSWATMGATVIVALLSTRVAWAGYQLCREVFERDSNDLIFLVGAIVDLLLLAVGAAMLTVGWAGIALGVGLWEGAPLARLVAMVIAVMTAVLALGDLDHWVGQCLLFGSLAVLLLLMLPTSRRDFPSWVGGGRSLFTTRRVLIAGLVLVVGVALMGRADAIGRQRAARGEVPTAGRFMTALADHDCTAALAESEADTDRAACEILISHATRWAVGEPHVVAPLEGGAVVAVPTGRDLLEVEVVRGKVTASSVLFLAQDVEAMLVVDVALGAERTVFRQERAYTTHVGSLTRASAGTVRWGIGQARRESPAGVAFVQLHDASTVCVSATSESGMVFMARVASNGETTYKSAASLPPCNDQSLERGYGW